MEIIDEVLEYAISLLGIPYRWYRSGENILEDDKFWAVNDEKISAEEIRRKNKSIVCTGLINLMRRYLSLKIPGADGKLSIKSLDEGVKGSFGKKFAGTTGIWFIYLKRRKRLEKFEPNSKTRLPRGTLLIRNFENIETDQGHVAVLFTDGEKDFLNNYIIHSYAEDEYLESLASGKKDVGKVGLTILKDSHFYHPEGYYTHYCRPENWLLTE